MARLTGTQDRDPFDSEAERYEAVVGANEEEYDSLTRDDLISD